MISIQKHIKQIKDNSERRNKERNNDKLSKYIIKEEIQRALNVTTDFTAWNLYRKIVELGYLQYNKNKESWEFCKNINMPYKF